LGEPALNLIGGACPQLDWGACPQLDWGLSVAMYGIGFRRFGET